MFGLVRKLFLLLVIAVLAGSAACFVNAGRWLVSPEARAEATEADAILVLAGSDGDRFLEAYELWREKRAPLIVLSPGFRDAGMREVQRRGLRVPRRADVSREVLVEQMGVPASAVSILEGELDSTAAEAVALREMAAARGWRRVIVVTSLPHTRRTGFAMTRALEGSGVTVQVRGSRFDDFQASRWWSDRGSARWILTELPKLVAYRLGLGE
jgi:uncharacterized SAM-binding protein YcdF (DUF218 family)